MRNFAGQDEMRYPVAMSAIATTDGLPYAKPLGRRGDDRLRASASPDLGGDVAIPGDKSMSIAR